MAWAEKIKANALDARFIAANLIEWFKENQSDALAWASEDFDFTPDAIKDKQFYSSETVVTVFPSFEIARIGYESEAGEDISDALVDLTYRVGAMHGDADRLRQAALIYELAFASMAKNAPKTRLENLSKIEFVGILSRLSTDYDVLRTDGSRFIQFFETTLEWRLEFQNRSG